MAAPCRVYEKHCSWHTTSGVGGLGKLGYINHSVWGGDSKRERLHQLLLFSLWLIVNLLWQWYSTEWHNCTCVCACPHLCVCDITLSLCTHTHTLAGRCLAMEDSPRPPRSGCTSLTGSLGRATLRWWSLQPTPSQKWRYVSFCDVCLKSHISNIWGKAIWRSAFIY